MLNNLLKSVSTIYIAYGVTDFRKQLPGLAQLVKSEYKMDPYNKAAYIFCNRRKNSIKILCYDKNGLIMAQKTLLDCNKMKFKWPCSEKDLKAITKQQLEWLLSGLEMYTFENIDVSHNSIVS